MGSDLTLKRGLLDGIPIFIGYFTTALAFGLMSRSLDFTLFETWLTSFFVYAGSSQFLILSLLKNGAGVLAIVISVFFINSRYIFMASSLSSKMDNFSSLGRLFAGFSTTDEVFALCSFKGERISLKYLMGLSLTSWSGWWSGSVVGALLGDILPLEVKRASIITVYAMFASLFSGESRRNRKAYIVFFLSASLNSILLLVFKLSMGYSIVISMIIGSILASFLYTDEEAGINE